TLLSAPSSILHPQSSLLQPPTIHEQRQALLEHFTISMQIHGEQLAGRRMRKQAIKYSRFHPNTEEVRSAFIAVSSLRQWIDMLNKWYALNGPGVWPPANAPDEVNESPDLQSCDAA